MKTQEEKVKKYCKNCMLLKEEYDERLRHTFNNCALYGNEMCVDCVDKCDTVNLSFSHEEFDELIELAKQYPLLQLNKRLKF